MLRYLEWLHNELQVPDGGREQYELIMDIYPVHITESVRNHAARLGFNVHFIPSGLTDRYQPLDRAVFGAVKATARSEYLKVMRKSPMNKITRAQAVAILQISYQKLSTVTLEAAWNIYSTTKYRNIREFHKEEAPIPVVHQEGYKPMEGMIFSASVKHLSSKQCLNK
jgi:hypothetical protein